MIGYYIVYLLFPICQPAFIFGHKKASIPKHHPLQSKPVCKEVKLTPSKGLITYAMYYYDSLGENCSLFVANKLAYFLQRQGAKSLSNIKFTAHHYGPYSPQISHIIYSLNGSYIQGFEQMNATAFEPLTMQYSRINEVSSYVRTLDKTEQDSLKETIRLISGFELTCRSILRFPQFFTFVGGWGNSFSLYQSYEISITLSINLLRNY